MLRVWMPGPAGTHLGIAMIIAVVLIPAGFCLGILSTKTDAVYLTGTHIGKTSFFDPPVEWARTDLARVVLYSEQRKGPYGRDHYIPITAFATADGTELF